jgi:purine-binding chemotaxis protein CheW
LRFGMPSAEANAFTVIIVVTVGVHVVGLVVDAVSDVLDVASADVQPPPDLGSGVDTGFLVGIAHAGDRLVVLLELERVIDHIAVGAVRGHAAALEPAAGA